MDMHIPEISESSTLVQVAEGCTGVLKIAIGMLAEFLVSMLLLSWLSIPND